MTGSIMRWRVLVLGLGGCTIAGEAKGQCGQPTWAMTMACAGADQGNSILVHSSGYLYVAGTTDALSGTQDVSLTKMTPGGTVIWSKALDLFGDDGGASVNLHEGNNGTILLGGHCDGLVTTSNGVVARLDTSGTVLWATRVMPGQNASYIRGVIETAAGDIYACGTTHAIGSGNSDALLARFSPSGEMQWLKAWGGSGNEHFTDLSLLDDGTILLSGEVQSFFGWEREGFYMRCDPNGGILSAIQYGDGGDSAFITHYRNADGTFLHTGGTNGAGQGGSDVELILTDEGGAVIWAATYGTSADERGINATAAADGGWMVSGLDMSTGALFIFKVDELGMLQWAIGPGDMESEYPALFGTQIVALPDGSFVLVGTGFAEDPMGDVRLVRVDACGVLSCGADTVLLVRGLIEPDVQVLTDLAEGSTSDLFSVITPIVQDFTSNTLQAMSQYCPGSCPVDVSLFPVSGCVGSPIALVPITSGVDSAFWSWDLGDGTTTTQAGPLEHVFDTAGVYTVNLVVNDTTVGCAVSVQAEVAVLAPPDFDLPADTALCAGTLLPLPAEGCVGCSFQWQDGSADPVVMVGAEGTYSLEGTNACGSWIDPMVVAVWPPPQPMIDQIICPGTSVVLDPLIDGGAVLWNTGDTAGWVAVGIGTFWYSAVDAHGCAWSDTAMIAVDPAMSSAVIVPNVFTPNGDGKNDRFQMIGAGQGELSLRVFDRWGLELWSTTDGLDGWNGKLENTGVEAPEGTYFYVLHYRPVCGSGITERAGSTSLLR